MSAEGDIPLLQDTAPEDVWGSWDPVYRDVVVVDGDGMQVAAFNLTTHDLGDPSEYAALKALLLQTAGE